MSTESRQEDAALTDVRLYGQRLSDTDEGFINVLYCGFKAGLHETRLPTARVFHFKQRDVISSGEVPDYKLPGDAVSYFDLPVNAEMYESRTQQVNLASEVGHATGGTFATLVATPPKSPGTDMTELESLSHDELLARARNWMLERSAGRGGQLAGAGSSAVASTLYQSYSWTSGGIGGPRPDPWGADND